jgi:SPP1 family predicted phage head-tail adaptor
MPLVKAGALRSRIDIVQPNGDQSGTGGITPGEPITVASRIPAEVTSGPLGETLQVGALQAAITSLVRIRYRPGIKSYMRVVLEGRTLQILAIVDVENRHVTLELTCAEIQ